MEATAFLQGLARQAQILACLHWLSNFQVLACIPLAQTVAFEDVADMVGVPTTHLSRVVRMMATAGFLREPQPGFVAHTTLSAQFVARPSFLDAAMFLCDTATPAALHMAEATRMHAQFPHQKVTAYQLALKSPTSTATEPERHRKLKRQLAAFQGLLDRTHDDNVAEILCSIDWSGLGDATVVHVGPPSRTAARALSRKRPNLHMIVQTTSPLPSTPALECCNITVHSRVRGSPQMIDDAAVYIIYVPKPALCSPSNNLTAQILADMQAHFVVLRSNTRAKLVIVAQILPEPGEATGEVEAAARWYDLSSLQTGSDKVLGMVQLMNLLGNVRDSTGRFVVVNQLFSLQKSLVALQVEIHAFPDR
nr:monodictyphenone cluster transcriptional coactivator mdpa [Quercus suber]